MSPTRTVCSWDVFAVSRGPADWDLLGDDSEGEPEPTSEEDASEDKDKTESGVGSEYDDDESSSE